MPLYHNTGEGWRIVDRWPYANEAELEQFLLANTQFIVGERDDVWTVWARQVGARSDNQLDLLGLGSDGSITIVECKLGSNREERREVVAQVLEYASALWKMPLDRFREVFRQQHALGADPFDLLEGLAPPEADEWDVAEALRVAELNLNYGRFRLIVAVDHVSQRLRDIVDFVNSRGQGDLKIVALSLPRFGDPASGVVAPEVHGDHAPAPSSKSADLVFPSVGEVLRQGATEMLPVVTKLHESLAGGDGVPGRLTPRTGKQSISYDAIGANGRPFPVMRLWPKSGRQSDPRPSSHLDLYGHVLERVGVTLDALKAEIAECGLEPHADGIRFRPEDVGQIDLLIELLDREIMSKLDQ